MFRFCCNLCRVKPYYFISLLDYNGYNNLITIATNDLQLGHNDTINEEQQIQQYQFDSPPDDFELDPAPQAADDPPLQPINEDRHVNATSS